MALFQDLQSIDAATNQFQDMQSEGRVVIPAANFIANGVLKLSCENGMNV
jgi:hypothetical protein